MIFKQEEFSDIQFQALDQNDNLGYLAFFSQAVAYNGETYYLFGVLSSQELSCQWLKVIQPTDIYNNSMQMKNIHIDELYSRLIMIGYTYSETSISILIFGLNGTFMSYTQSTSYIGINNSTYLDSSSRLIIPSTGNNGIIRLTTYPSVSLDFYVNVYGSTLYDAIYDNTNNNIFAVGNIDGIASVIQITMSGNQPTLTSVSQFDQTLETLTFQLVTQYSNTLTAFSITDSIDYLIYCLFKNIYTSFTDVDIICRSKLISTDLTFVEARQLNADTAYLAYFDSTNDQCVYKLGVIGLTSTEFNIKVVNYFATTNSKVYIYRAAISNTGIGYFTFDQVKEGSDGKSISNYRAAIHSTENSCTRSVDGTLSSTFDGSLTFSISVNYSFDQYQTYYSTFQFNEYSSYSQVYSIYDILNPQITLSLCYPTQRVSGVTFLQKSTYPDITYYLSSGTNIYNIEQFEFLINDSECEEDVPISYSLIQYNNDQQETPSYAYLFPAPFDKFEILIWNLDNAPTGTIEYQMQASYEVFDETILYAYSNKIRVSFSTYSSNCQSSSTLILNSGDCASVTYVTGSSEISVDMAIDYNLDDFCSLDYNYQDYSEDLETLKNAGILDINLGKPEFTVYSELDSYVGSYSFTINIDETSNGIQGFCIYYITILSSECNGTYIYVMDPELSSSYSYDVAQGEQILETLEWSLKDTECEYYITPVEYSLSDSSGSLVSDSIINLSSDNEITINTTNSSYTGTHTIILSVNPQAYTVSFDITITDSSTSSDYELQEIENTAPYFIYNPPNLEIEAGIIFDYSLPDIEDDEDDSYTVTASLGNGSSFMTFSQNQNRLYINSKSYHVGSYLIYVIITDDNYYSKSNIYWFVITITDSTESTSDTDTTEQSSNNTNVTDIGEMYSEYLLSRDLFYGEKTIQNKSQISTSLTAKIQAISATGLMTIQFNNDIVTFSNISKIDDKVLLIKMKSSSTEKVSYVSWKSQSCTNNKLYIQLEFEEPLKISQEVNQIVDIFLAKRQNCSDIFTEWIFHGKRIRISNIIFIFDIELYSEITEQ